MLLKYRGFFAYILVIFLNAFVDLGHKIVIQNTIFKVYEGQNQIILTAIVNALILLPFILLMSPAGFCSDKYPKNRVMRVTSWVAVFITLCITLFYYLGWFWPAFVMTFILALQSTFYSPAKYGFIKEMVGKEHLAAANGLVQMVTTISILAGIFIFSILFEYFLSDVFYNDLASVLNNIAPIGWGLVIFSLIELMLAYSLPQKTELNKSMRFSLKKYVRGQYLQHNMHVIWHRKVILFSVIGLAIFWSISQVMLAAFPTYAEEVMKINNTVIVQGTLAWAGLGIMLGSVIAGRLSDTYIEIGMMPVGLVGIALCLFILPYLGNVYWQAFNFLIWGVFGGFVLIPLNALIQFHAAKDELGRIVAGSNFLRNCMMLCSLGLVAMFALYGLNSENLFAILLVVSVAGTLYMLYKLPQSLLRFIVGYIIGYCYRLRVTGLKHMPEAAGVLMAGNSNNWVDLAIVQMASPRAIRFVIPHDIYRGRVLKWFLTRFNVIPVSSLMGEQSCKKVIDSLRGGDVVCFFPESAVNPARSADRFLSTYGKLAKAGDAVILPFFLQDNIGKKPEKPRAGARRDITVAFGEVLSSDIQAIDLKPLLDSGAI